MLLRWLCDRVTTSPRMVIRTGQSGETRESRDFSAQRSGIVDVGAGGGVVGGDVGGAAGTVGGGLGLVTGGRGAGPVATVVTGGPTIDGGGVACDTRMVVGATALGTTPGAPATVVELLGAIVVVVDTTSRLASTRIG